MPVRVRNRARAAVPPRSRKPATGAGPGGVRQLDEAVISLCRELSNRVTVVVGTADLENANVASAFDAGAADVVSLPFAWPQLLPRLAALGAAAEEESIVRDCAGSFGYVFYVMQKQ